MARNVSALPQIGSLFADQYEIVELIGQGGMGVVYRARQIRLQRDVALKVLRPEVLASGYEQFRLEREAVSAARFRSHHVVDIYDWGIAPGGPAYLVMELLHGETLGQLLQRQAVQEPEQVAAWLVQCCEALDEAAALGIVHRDIKPANLFLAATQTPGSIEVKILDFGITKIFHSAGVGVSDEVTTRSSLRLGTPRYMSPEQLRATSSVDARADIWSLGVVVYQALSGHYPFDNEYEADLIVSILSEEPRPLSSANPRLSRAVSHAVARALQKDVEARYRSAGEFAQTLIAALNGTPLARSRHASVRAVSLPITPQFDTLPPHALQLGTSASEDSRRAPVSASTRRRTTVLQIAAVASIVAAALAFAASQQATKTMPDAARPASSALPTALGSGPPRVVGPNLALPPSATLPSAARSEAGHPIKPVASVPRTVAPRFVAPAAPASKAAAHQFERNNPYDD